MDVPTIVFAGLFVLTLAGFVWFVRPRRHGLRHQIGAVLRSPWLAGANVVFGVFAGVLAATFHDDLETSVPVAWFKGGCESGLVCTNSASLIFWSITLTFAGIWMSKEWLASKDRQHETSALLRHIDTIPPPDFLKLQSRLFRGLVQYIGASEDAPTTETLLEDIRWVLDVAIQLAARWDFETGNVTNHYRANVMVDIGPIDPDNERLTTAGSRLLGERGFKAARANADGGLWVDERLATGQAVDGAMDREVQPLLLLYSQTGGINLYGAPVAFVSNDSRYIANTLEILEAFPMGLSQEAREAAAAFYRADEKAQSIIALPVPLPASLAGTSAGAGADEDPERNLVGILNIYRDSPNIMGSRSRASNFGHLMTPLVAQLGNLVAKLDIASLQLGDRAR